MDGINFLDIDQEKITKYEDTAVETTQNDTERKQNFEKQTASVSLETISNSLEKGEYIPTPSFTAPSREEQR